MPKNSTGDPRNVKYPVATWCLPEFLTAATSLELLDLRDNFILQLRGAEDARLLRMLPWLRHVVLPYAKDEEEAAAAVDCIRQGLQESTGSGAGPSHWVEVEGRALC